MFPLFSPRRLVLILLALPLALGVATLRGPDAAPAALPVAAAPAIAPAALAVVPAAPVPAAPAKAPIAAPAVPAATAVPTATPQPAPAPLRVGIQADHWKSGELPDELARLRTSAGAFAAGHSEWQVNLDIARRVAARLQDRGVIVDLLPATVPPAYEADAFVAIHADGSPAASNRGFKLATPWRTSRASQHLFDTITAEYDAATSLPHDDAITFNMRGYYAFSWRRHVHSVAKTTPAVIVEMGFLTSPTDRSMMLNKPDVIAAGIANGVLRYLKERDPKDTDALMPPDFKTQRSASDADVIVRASPRDNARVLLRAPSEARFMPIQERDGWYEVIVRGQWRVVGWVRKEALIETNEPPPTPPPATDS